MYSIDVRVRPHIFRLIHGKHNITIRYFEIFEHSNIVSVVFLLLLTMFCALSFCDALAEFLFCVSTE